MSDAGPSLFAGIDLRPGEQVLWEGRPGFGVPRHELRRLVKGFFSVGATGFAVLVAYFGIAAGPKLFTPPADEIPVRLGALLFGAALLSLLPTFVICLGIYLGKLSRSSAGAIVILLVGVPLWVWTWLLVVKSEGVMGAMRLTHPAVPCLFILGIPA